MSEVKHTPEPWKTHNVYGSLAPGINSKNGDCVLVWKHKNDAFDTGLYGNVEQTQANAARIVACVNHCKGATNEELEQRSYEQLVSMLENEARDSGVYQSEIKKLKAQCKELLDALRDMVGIVKESRGVDGFHANGDIAEWDEFHVVKIAQETFDKYEIKDEPNEH